MTTLTIGFPGIIRFHFDLIEFYFIIEIVILKIMLQKIESINRCMNDKHSSRNKCQKRWMALSEGRCRLSTEAVNAWACRVQIGSCVTPQQGPECTLETAMLLRSIHPLCRTLWNATLPLGHSRLVDQPGITTSLIRLVRNAHSYRYSHLTEKRQCRRRRRIIKKKANTPLLSWLCDVWINLYGMLSMMLYWCYGTILWEGTEGRGSPCKELGDYSLICFLLYFSFDFVCS